MLYTTPSIANLRTAGSLSSRCWLSCAPMSRLKLWQGNVNGVIIDRGATSISYDGGVAYNGAAFADILPHHLVTVASDAGVERLYLRTIAGTVASGVLTLQQNNIVWENNQVITIYRDFPLFGIRPKIALNGEFFKDLDVPYSDQNTLPPPVAVVGPDWANWISRNNIAILNGTDSYAVASGATIVSYLWTAEPSAGVVIADETASTTYAQFSVSGPYWIKLTVTDSNGKSGYCRAQFHAHDNSYLPIPVEAAKFVTDYDQKPSPLEFEIYEPESADVLPNFGRLVCWSEDSVDGVITSEYNGGWVGHEHIRYASAYVSEGSIEKVPGSAKITFKANSILGLMDNISNYSVSIAYVASPTKWYEYGNTGITLAQALHHLWKWHSTLLEMTPVILPVGNTLRRYAVDDEFARGSLLQQASNLSYDHAIFAKIACNEQGVIHVESDGQVYPSTVSDAFALSDCDWEEMTIERQPIKSVCEVTLGGFYYDGVEHAILSKAPGDVIENTGTEVVNADRAMLLDQASANVLSGRLLAKENNETPLVHMEASAGVAFGNIFRVVPQSWYDITLDPEDTGYILDWSTGKDMLVRRVETEYKEGEFKQLVDFEPYAEGADGVDGDYPSGG